MKRKLKGWIVAMGVISLAGMSLTACGQKQEAEPDEVVEATETAEPTPEEKISELLTKANDEGTLIDKYGSIAWRNKTYLADGTVVSGYIYRDDSYFYSEEEGSFFVDDDGDVYGYISGNDNPEYRNLFIGDAYREYQEYYEVTGLLPEDVEDAVLDGGADKDGMLTVESAREMAESEKSELEELGYTGLKSAKMRFVYTVDKDSYEIADEKIYLVKKDDKEKLIQEHSWLFDEEKPKMEQAYMDRVFSDDFRKVQVIVDPGSPKEQTYTQTVGKGCAVLTMLPISYDQNLYQDAACTKKIEEGDTDPESDVVLYALSTEGGHGSTAAQQESSDDGSVSESDGQGGDVEEESEAKAECPYCGERFSIEDKNGTSDYQWHVDLEKRLETAKIHLGDQTPLEVVGGAEYAELCPWCKKWYSIESTDGVTSDYATHVQWEKEYEAVYNALNQ